MNISFSAGKSIGLIGRVAVLGYLGMGTLVAAGAGVVVNGIGEFANGIRAGVKPKPVNTRKPATRKHVVKVVTKKAAPKAKAKAKPAARRTR